MGRLRAGYTAHMASAEPQRATSPALIAAGVALAIAVIVVAFVLEPEVGWAVLVLAVICVVAAVGARIVTSRGGGGDTDSTSHVPQQQPRGERPLGDTPEAHDEINPHDIPRDSPAREPAEDMAGGEEGTTRGPLPGG